MTLVAAFRSYNIPALIGDLLITTTGKKETQRKKLRIVADQLAIAWTGHLVAAETVVEALQIRLAKHQPLGRNVLESILTDPNFVELGSRHVTLLGWIVEDTTAHCFCWNSDYPIEVFYGDPMFDGSGEFEARRLFGEVGIRSSDPIYVSDREDAVAGVLSTVTNLMKAEVVGPSFRHLGFGFAYEAILLNEEFRFEYINNVLYYSLVHELNDEGNYLSSRFTGKPIKVTDCGGNSLIFVYDPDRKEQSYHLIRPVGLPIQFDQEALIAELTSSQRVSPFSAANYCAFLSFEAPDFSSPPFVESFDGQKSLKLVDLTDPDVFTLKIDPARIEWTYRLIREDMGK